VTNLIIGLLGAALATNPGAATSNLLQQTTGISVNIPNPNDPVEQEYDKLLADDDAALAGVDQILRDNDKAKANGTRVLNEDEMQDRIQGFLAPMRKEYEDFLRRHPDHARAHIAFGSFLNDIHDEDAARTEYEKAIALDPTIPAAWNNLANLYGHTGPVSKMFELYTKAIDLDPTEPVYYENLATVVYLYRVDAREFYHFTNDQPVFDKAMRLYEKALSLDPTNFALATELAQSYYGIKPTRTEDALNAWTNALKIAHTDLERQGVYIHLARFKLNAGRFAEARADVAQVSDPSLDDLKQRILRNLALHDFTIVTNAPDLRASCPSGRGS
jgi:tetratricopeptide (TPR) repeat protein